MFQRQPAVKKTISTDTLIGQATRIEGQIHCDTDLRIEGHVNGDVVCTRDVTVGESGRVTSNLKAANVVLAGQLHGDVEISGNLMIETTGVLNGNFTCASLIIKEGGTFNGSSRMSSDTTPKHQDDKADDLS
ncbi:bactofilin family protein [Paenibacillus sp. 481]|uniref:bactofilin family protein n=1 Tax=Paenibacillus sp. 481 TaxID=2835869 RepID=UPI001E402138|nr:polymer-forming cytoskeletal protein [Paenibacillus sp. 481]UHA74382.1 polymer-forming cytoskeletal protein [Paenibacillus sp. 481]